MSSFGLLGSPGVFKANLLNLRPVFEGTHPANKIGVDNAKIDFQSLLEKATFPSMGKPGDTGPEPVKPEKEGSDKVVDELMQVNKEPLNNAMYTARSLSLNNTTHSLNGNFSPELALNAYRVLNRSQQSG